MKNKFISVLLIDDDAPTNYLNSLLIEESGCAKNIKVITGGKDALQYLLSGGYDPLLGTIDFPDLIFLDINMPAMNGWEFLSLYNQKIQLQPPNMVLIMLSASLNSEDKNRAKALPIISGFETKPLTKEKIFDIMEKYFPSCIICK